MGPFISRTKMELSLTFTSWLDGEVIMLTKMTRPIRIKNADAIDPAIMAKKYFKNLLITCSFCEMGS